MNVVNLLERCMQAHPHKVAFADSTQSLTYTQVWETAQHIASALLTQDEVPNQPVAVLIDRNVESICTFMGIALSRNFYVPIDQTQPPERIASILGQIRPKALVAIGELPADLEVPEHVPLLWYAELVQAPVDEQAIAQVRSGCLDIDPCYAICTSGSTGVPKAVLVSHRSVLDFIPVFVDTFGFAQDEVFGNQAPFDFDVSVKDIYSTLYCGATMFIIPRKCFSMPKLLVRTLDEQHITTLVWAVSAVCIVATVNGFKHGAPKSIRNVLFSGEVMPIKLLNVWRQALPNATFVNLYGPTEITCNCMYYVLDREFQLTERLPLGKTFANEEVLVLDEHDRPITPGQTGEICVTGTCLALGYYRNPQRTAEAFVQNPLNDAYPQLMYRTGDLAELAEDGNYYFAARKDFQIKHMGHRIELEEIEAHMGAVEGVARACCLFDEQRNKIVGCYVGEANKVQIINELKRVVPKYMIPNIFVRLEQMPLTKNGKIDRKELRGVYEQGRR
ncbi:MAG: amino acid adenylation domain-containing protein [Coriobacteriales bacterium]|nr:amino acid adenylation domain-containing protein [Coriobacteriales bacterium]